MRNKSTLEELLHLGMKVVGDVGIVGGAIAAKLGCSAMRNPYAGDVILGKTPDAIKQYHEWVDNQMIVDRVYHDNIYIYNEHTEDIAVAIHYNPNGNWITKSWFKVRAKSSELILSERLVNSWIYIHAHTNNGLYWGDENYRWLINGEWYRFFERNTGSDRGRHNITLVSNK